MRLVNFPVHIYGKHNLKSVPETSRKIIFFIGPGGVGKTTCGRLLADRLNYQLLDLDDEFINQVGNIEGIIKNEGYQRYYESNSALFFQILGKIREDTIFILSSGFLIYNRTLTNRHLKAIKSNGASILLLPSRSLEKSVQIILKRQLGRGLGLVKEKEEEKFRKRFEIYRRYGDIQIYSASRPTVIVKRLISSLNNLTQTNLL